MCASVRGGDEMLQSLFPIHDMVSLPLLYEAFALFPPTEVTGVVSVFLPSDFVFLYFSHHSFSKYVSLHSV